jgi:hypothetical protein
VCQRLLRDVADVVGSSIGEPLFAALTHIAERDSEFRTRHRAQQTARDGRRLVTRKLAAYMLRRATLAAWTAQRVEALDRAKRSIAGFVMARRAELNDGACGLVQSPDVDSAVDRLTRYHAAADRRHAAALERVRQRRLQRDLQLWHEFEALNREKMAALRNDVSGCAVAVLEHVQTQQRRQHQVADAVNVAKEDKAIEAAPQTQTASVQTLSTANESETPVRRLPSPPSQLPQHPETVTRATSYHGAQTKTAVRMKSFNPGLDVALLGDAIAISESPTEPQLSVSQHSSPPATHTRKTTLQTDTATVALDTCSRTPTREPRDDDDIPVDVSVRSQAIRRELIISPGHLRPQTAPRGGRLRAAPKLHEAVRQTSPTRDASTPTPHKSNRVRAEQPMLQPLSYLNGLASVPSGASLGGRRLECVGVARVISPGRPSSAGLP